MFATIVTWILKVIPVLGQIIPSIENLWASQPKSGQQKWLSVENALSGSIQLVANEAAKLSPAGTTAEEISTAVDVFTKDVNDAVVTLMNDLKLFPHAGQPAANAVTAPAATNAKSG